MRRRIRTLLVAAAVPLLLLTAGPAQATLTQGSSIDVAVPDVTYAPDGCSRYPIIVVIHGGFPFGRLDDVTLTLQDAYGRVLGSAYTYAATDGMTQLTDDLQVCSSSYEGSAAPYTLKVVYEAYRFSTVPSETLLVPWTFTPLAEPPMDVYLLGPSLRPSVFSPGERVTVICKLRYAGRGVPGEPVRMVFNPNGGATVSRTPRSGAGGAVRMVIRPRNTGVVQCRYAGDATHEPARSGKVRLTWITRGR